MRVVVGPVSSEDSRQCELRRHLKLMSRFVESAPRRPSITMVLRSAESDPAKALIGMKGALQRVGATAQVILAKLEPQHELKQLFAALSALAPQVAADELIRWARNPRLLDAHEQVTYGEAMCWSGDAMRRESDKRNPLVLLDEGSDAVRLGRLAFARLWEGSSAVPMRRLIGPTGMRPSGAYEQFPDPSVDPSALRPSLQGWPLVRH